MAFHVLYRDLAIRPRSATMDRYGVKVCVALLYMAAAVSAAQNYTNLCSCTDLLWVPQPSSAWEVINWHSKLVEELNAARATGVCPLTRPIMNSLQHPSINDRTHMCSPLRCQCTRHQDQPVPMLI